MQVPSKGGDDKMLTVGKAELDLARFAGLDRSEQPKLVPILFKVGGHVWGGSGLDG